MEVELWVDPSFGPWPEAVVELLRRGITTRDIITRESLLNAIAVVVALGGSTNAVLHLLAIAHEAHVQLDIEDFNTVADKVPHLANVKPFGQYVMSDVDRIGGVPVVMKALLDAGLLHGDALTVTGKTVRENLKDVKNAEQLADQDVVHAAAKPIRSTGGMVVVRGNLAPEGGVVKVANVSRLRHVGPCLLYTSPSPPD